MSSLCPPDFPLQPEAGQKPSRARWRRQVRRRLGRHRRAASALLLAAAAGLGVHAATAQPPQGVEVAVAAADLPAGHAVRAADVRLSRWPTDSVPAGILGPEALVGRRLSGAVRAGEPLTDLRVAGTAPAGLAGGRVAMPVDVRSGAVRWLEPGARVTLLAAREDLSAASDGGSGPPPAHVVARDVVVLDVPPVDAEGLMETSDLTGSTTVLVAVRMDEAAGLAAVGGGWWISPVVLP